MIEHVNTLTVTILIVLTSIFSINLVKVITESDAFYKVKLNRGLNSKHMMEGF